MTEVETETEALAWNISDMMAACMYIFVILLVVYAYMFRANYEDAPAVGPLVSDVIVRRTQALDSISDALARRGIDHFINSELGEIAIDPLEISFRSATAQLRDEDNSVIISIGAALGEGLACFAVGLTDKSRMNCPEGVEGSLFGIIIVGHTDNIPMGPNAQFLGNIDLSAQRAAQIVRMLEEVDALTKLRNREGNPLLVALGVGARRPTKTYDRPTDDPANRRITIRLQMDVPWVTF